MVHTLKRTSTNLYSKEYYKGCTDKAFVLPWIWYTRKQKKERDFFL